MNQFNIDWHEFYPTGGKPELQANVLGYHIEIFQGLPLTSDLPAVYCARYREANSSGETWPIVLVERDTEEQAKAQVNAWLAKQVRAVGSVDISNACKDAGFDLAVGLRYALQFMEALRPHLAKNDSVEVVPAKTADEHSGLYLRNLATGCGVRVLSCSRAEYVAMATGTLAELDDADEDFASTTYFHETEIGAYANVAANLYLSSGKRVAARIYHQPG